MSRRSSLSYREALRILAGDDVKIADLETTLGTSLLVAAPFTHGATLALLDAQGPFIRLIREITKTPAGRIKAAQGRTYYELLEASHTVLAVSAFFEGFRAEIGPGFDRLELTDEEKAGAVVRHAYTSSLPEELSGGAFPLPSAVKGFDESRREIKTAYGKLFDASVAFCEGLAAWPKVRPVLDLTALRPRVVDHCIQLYEDRFDQLATDLPEFGFRTLRQQLEGARETVRHEVRPVNARLDALLDLNRNLIALVDQQRATRQSQVQDVLDRLAHQLDAALRAPLWRTEETDSGIVFPAVHDGFVSPDFRWAIYSKAAREERDAPVARDDWWRTQARGSDLAGFLTRYMTDPESPHRPLVILGQPGAGKTLLAKVIAARLPTEAFTTIVVPLRRVDADAPPHIQIQTALGEAVRDTLTWGKLRRETTTTKVVIFDGFDELVQVTGVAQSAYVQGVADFQEEEWDQGHSVIPIITSRTLVMDRVPVPEGTVLVRLEELSDQQVDDWVGAVNRINAGREDFRRLSAAELLRHDELARQPLLITLLAIYYTERRGGSGTGADLSDSMSRADLFGRLMTSFIARQVIEKSRDELGETERAGRQERLRRELAFAAFAMFNRNQQVVSGVALRQDLGCFAVPAAEAPAHGFREPLSADRVVTSAFFFVYSAGEADHPDDRRTYEFRHGSIGDFLIAEYVVGALQELTRMRAQMRSIPGYGSSLDSRQFRALLGHQPLVKREAVIHFAAELFQELPESRAEVAETIARLLNEARQRGSLAGIDSYQPSAYDPVRLLAAYTANLVVLAALATPDGVRHTELMDEPAWSSTVRLWRAGLDEKGQLAMLSWLRRDGDGRITVQRRRHVYGPERIAVEEARLVGDLATYAHLQAGAAAWMDHQPRTIGSGKFHAEVVALAVRRWPVPSLGQLTLWDVRRYQDLLDSAVRHPERISTASAALLLECLTEDGLLLPREVVCGLVRLALDGVPDSPTAPPELIIACPYLIDEFPQLVASIGLPEDHAALHALILRRGLSRIPAEFAPTVERIVNKLESRLTEVPLEGGVMSAEMVEQFAAVGVGNRTARFLLAALSEFGPLAWRQIHPAALVDLLSHQRPDEFVDEAQLGALVADYLRAHGRKVKENTFAASKAALASYAADRRN